MKLWFLQLAGMVAGVAGLFYQVMWLIQSWASLTHEITMPFTWPDFKIWWIGGSIGFNLFIILEIWLGMKSRWSKL